MEKPKRCVAPGKMGSCLKEGCVFLGNRRCRKKGKVIVQRDPEEVKM